MMLKVLLNSYTSIAKHTPNLHVVVVFGGEKISNILPLFHRACVKFFDVAYVYIFLCFFLLLSLNGAIYLFLCENWWDNFYLQLYFYIHWFMTIYIINHLLNGNFISISYVCVSVNALCIGFVIITGLNDFGIIFHLKKNIYLVHHAQQELSR